MGFNTGTIGWVETGDTMKWVGAGWVDDIDGLGRVGTGWGAMVVDRHVSRISSSIVTSGWGGLGHWTDGVGRGGW